MLATTEFNLLKLKYFEQGQVLQLFELGASTAN